MKRLRKKEKFEAAVAMEFVPDIADPKMTPQHDKKYDRDFFDGVDRGAPSVRDPDPANKRRENDEICFHL